MYECFCGYRAGFPATKTLHNLMVTTVDLLAVLTLVGKQSCLLSLPHRSDVHVIGRMEAHGLGAKIDFVGEQLEPAPAGQPGSKGESAGGLVIQVGVDGPLREDDVRTLGGKDPAERFDGFGIHHGGAVDLTSE